MAIELLLERGIDVDCFYSELLLAVVKGIYLPFISRICQNFFCPDMTREQSSGLF
jgi:hypothetical protein